MIKAIIFDLDGVIVDSLNFITDSFQEVLEKEGYKVNRNFILKRIGIGAEDVFKEFFDYHNIKYDDSYLMDMTNKLDITQKMNINKLKVFEEFYELIKYLKKFKVGVATMSSRSRAELKVSKVRCKFDVLLSDDDVKRPKPYPDIYIKSAKLLKVKPGECIVFEDAIYGVEAAKKAGMKCIGVTTGYYNERELKAKGADLVVKSLIEKDKITSFIENN